MTKTQLTKADYLSFRAIASGIAKPGMTAAEFAEAWFEAHGFPTERTVWAIFAEYLKAAGVERGLWAKAEHEMLNRFVRFERKGHRSTQIDLAAT